ncbi:nuclear pore complex protein NUP50B-like [Rutidosis leptorrhynchoides]|uniref:nuclear pore complex protein NUP50B-like n=1 Tax=Rutidosis leptorrhynchoides TaxID=125765 RepID=UPI003A9978AF
MGDAENTLPPTKKRAAGRELSRDNPGLDDEEEVPGQETGTFKRASEEVLANRRIVKVKRSQTSSTPSAPSSNPFAAIRLVPPAGPTPTPTPVNNSQDIEKPSSEKIDSPESVNGKPKVEDGDNGKQPEPINSEVDKENNENKDKVEENAENTPVPEKKNDENKDKLDENDESAPAAGSVNSFGQLSSNQNAFTGLVGTGFSSSSFSFGSIPKIDQPTFPPFGFATNGNSSLFGNTDKTEGTKIPSMQEVQVETGEENETSVFAADSVLFEFLDGGWKERGKGELKVNVLTTGTKKARLVMRARGNYRLILNASIFPDMKLTNMEKKGITFACLNSIGEGQSGISTFALKFKDPSLVEEFRSVIMSHKGNTPAPVLKTPENSPKASDE